MDRRNIVLTGFMGTGKTSVGQELAKLLQREFVDMDAWIQARADKRIAEIFAEHGEARFREMERALIQELAARENLVVATGGGAWVNSENRAAFWNAHVICLDASIDEILRRLAGASDRPLLQGDKRARIHELLEARRELYSQIPIHIQTDGCTPDALAHEIIARLELPESRARIIRVRTPDSIYSIFLGRDVLGHITDYFAPFAFASRCAIVTNPTVARLYGERVMDSLLRAGFEPLLIEIPDGEQHKNLDTVRGLYDQFIAAKLERRSPILALGGGVIGDTAGFAAATFLRGVPLVQIPTTLLAMVDSSIGGKVAVNHSAGKNLIGAFKFPACVIADIAMLNTLPVEEFRAGMAEVIKHAVIGDGELFAELREMKELGEQTLERALRVKVEIVERDPFEENIRAHLNLGHTFGQAIETLAKYEMRHGDAVAMGIAIAARLAAKLGWCSTETRDEILALLEKYELPTYIPRVFSPEQISEAMGADKKIQNKRLRLILPRAIGRVEIAENVSHEEILRALQDSII